MTSRNRLITLTLFGALGLVFLLSLYLLSAPKMGAKEVAIKKAKEAYALQKKAGVDFSDGPCLSNNLMKDWVADIAHNPRTSVDNQPQNQCSAYREGRAEHYVELDPDGNYIGAQ